MKKFLIVCLLGLFAATQAQNLSSSPYSALGIGDQLFDNNPEFAGMGGLSTAVDGVLGASANFSNPAANHNLSWTTFNFGLNSDNQNLKSNQASATNSANYVSNLSLAFPVGEKMKMGFGFQPYTADGYSIRSEREPEDQASFINTFKGDGGVNSLQIMASRNIGKNLSVGLRADYLFGDISRTQQIIVQNSELLTEYNYQNQLSGLRFTAGAFYGKELKDKKKINFAAKYSTSANLKSDVDNLISTYFPVNNIPTNIDTISYARLDGADTKIPQEISIGVSYSKNLNWMIGAQVDFSNWSDFELAGDTNPNAYTNSYKATLGGFWLPNFNSYKSYFDRITYRAGAYYQQTPFNISNTNINQYGITFGLGLPVGKAQNPSMLNLAFDLGQRGTLSNNLIREQYFKFKIGFTLNAVWFQKRIYD